MIDLLFYYKGYIILLGIVLLCFTVWMVVDIIRYKKQKIIKAGDVTITQKPQNKCKYITIIVCWVVMMSIAVLMMVDKIQDYNYKKYLDSLPEYRIWNSAYTEEEHIQNVRERASYRLPDGEAFNVYVLYSFDDKPEYFLVERTDVDAHQIIMVVQDEYYIIWDENYISLWRHLGILNNNEYKKYFGFIRTAAYEFENVTYGCSAYWVDESEYDNINVINGEEKLPIYGFEKYFHYTRY